DRGDWGTVTENETEVVTTIWVDNPNPFPIALGSGLSATYNVSFNDVALASGEKDALSVPKGNSTLRLNSTIRNDRLPAWWARFVRANETIAMTIDGDLTVDVGPSASYGIHREQTVLENSTPIITALSQAANGTTGTYTTSVGTDQLDASLLDGLVGEDTQSVTVGYEIREADARWGSVTRRRTTLLFDFTIHNPGDVPVPAVPDGLGAEIEMNGVRMFETETGTLSPRSVGPDAVIPPGETRTVTYAVRMNNSKVDEWFTSHVRRGELTTVRTSFQLVFGVPSAGVTVRAPADSPVTYTCDLRTAILVDNQTTSTDCGSPPGQSDASGADGGEGNSSNGTPTPAETTDGGLLTGTPTADAPATPTATVVPTTLSTPTDVPTDVPTTLATPTETPAPPTARLSANTTSGAAPLTVAFDASESTDPNGNIAEYAWQFGDGSTARGQRVTHTFERAGTYVVTVTVVDETGRQDTEDVTITVTVG
ncbi:MAG: PKD domain-containing protein, partial [Haloarculaceae archaeon]